MFLTTLSQEFHHRQVFDTVNISRVYGSLLIQFACLIFCFCIHDWTCPAPGSTVLLLFRDEAKPSPPFSPQNLILKVLDVWILHFYYVNCCKHICKILLWHFHKLRIYRSQVCLLLRPFYSGQLLQQIGVILSWWKKAKFCI